MKIDRLIAIIMILLEQDKISARRLAELFEVSTRTIYRDLDVINQAGIPILSTSGPSGGVEILKTYKIEKRLFSTSDIASLLMGLGSIESTLKSNDLVNTLAKVKGMIPLNQQRELEWKANQIKIDVKPWLYSHDLSNTIKGIRIALDENKLLCFDYMDIRGQKSRRNIEPYRLLLKGEDWYVQGYCLERNDYRTFKLLRMANVRMLEETFVPMDFPFEKLSDAHFNDITLVPAKLYIHESIKDTILIRFGADCLEPDKEGYYFANVHLPIDDLACSYLLGFGDKCICLEPLPLKEKMRELSEAIYRFYH